MTAFAGFVDALRLAGDATAASACFATGDPVPARGPDRIEAVVRRCNPPAPGRAERFDAIVVVGGLIPPAGSSGARGDLPFPGRRGASQRSPARPLPAPFILARAGLLDHPRLA